MTRVVTAEVGFLIAVLWFDLMHDVQVLGKPDAELPSAVRESVAHYYRRVTIDAFPMNRLVALVMVSAIGCTASQLAVGGPPRWMSATSLGLVVAATGLAAVRTVPNAQRLGRHSDEARTQSRLARAVCLDHFVCLGAVVTVLTLELVFG